MKIKMSMQAEITLIRFGEQIFFFTLTCLVD